jgi:H+-transporting ATPase
MQVDKTETPSHLGLADSAVAEARKKYGWNELPAPHESLVLLYLKNFWGPLPWLMELLIVVSLFSGQKIEGGIIAFLLVVNSFVSLFQRRSADAALAILTKNLSTYARTERNGRWGNIPARELVPGDFIRVRTGDIVPADVEISDGNVSVDVSSLTGESLPKESASGDGLFSGSIIRRGEATARVTAIGAATAYGKTTELLETSHPPTHMEKIIFGIIKYFFVLNFFLAIVIVIFGLIVHAAPTEMINFVIVLLLTSVPISFPTMFAVAQSYGALELGKSKDRGALVRRLAAVQECAMVDVLCSDKTGTLTQNNLQVSETVHYGSYSEADVMSFAGAASDEADEDSIDKAILERAVEGSVAVLSPANFLPFDPKTKRTEADVTLSGGAKARILKGLPSLLLGDDVVYHEEAKADVARMSANGLRVVAVIVRRTKDECAGLIALADPIRPDAPNIIKELEGLGVRVVMITGDGRATARAVALQLGLSGDVVTAEELKKNPEDAVESSVFAEAYPEDKLTIIRALQKAGHTVAMTGDGVNDAPALRQAEVGIAVSGATDVAKQSASFILTSSGLEGVVRAVKVSRGVYARLRTWALNKIVKSFEVSVFTTIIFFVLHSYILSPLLAVLLVFANDFVTISIATDRSYEVPKPARWRLGHFALGAAILACVPIALLSVAYLVARSQNYPLDAVRTAIYLAMIFYGKANLYAVRAWPHAWATWPSRTLVIATAFSCIFALVISTFGFLISSVSLGFAAFVIVAAVLDFFIVDVLKQSSIVRRLLGA